MKTVAYFFLIGAVIELIAGISLILIYDNPLGFMGLIASACMCLALPIVDSFAD